MVDEGELEALKMLTDRRDLIAHQRVQTVNLLQRRPVATQAKAMLATARPRNFARKTRRRMAAEQIADLVALAARVKKIKAELAAAVPSTGRR